MDSTRTYVDRNPGFLVGLRSRAPEHQRLADSYIGSWMVITGKLGEVAPGDPPVRVAFLNKPTKIVMDFHAGIDKLRALPQGSMISMAGRIKEISTTGLWLDECELLYP